MENFIRTYELSRKDNCKKIINWFDENESNFAHPGRVISSCDSNDRKDINCKISSDISININEAYKLDYFAEILDYLWVCVLDYIKEFEELSATMFSMVENFNIQKYTPPEGGFFKYHCERTGIITATRMITWMIYLNTVEDDGHTEFKYQKKLIKAEEGKIVIWPTDFTHTHRGVRSKTEEKYIMTGWYNFI